MSGFWPDTNVVREGSDIASCLLLIFPLRLPTQRSLTPPAAEAPAISSSKLWVVPLRVIVDASVQEILLIELLPLCRQVRVLAGVCSRRAYVAGQCVRPLDALSKERGLHDHLAGTEPAARFVARVPGVYCRRSRLGRPLSISVFSVQSFSN